MRRSVVILLFCLCGAATLGRAQAVESADVRQFTIDAGGMLSAFQPGEGDNGLIGFGTYADLHFSHWFQVEGEARWLRLNQYYGEHQDNYLIGPRVPIHQFGRQTQLYGKALVGYGRMTFPFGFGYGSFTDFAFGAAVDHRLSRKLSVKADFEYQYWPVFLNNQSLSPYGGTVGIGYRVF